MFYLHSNVVSGLPISEIVSKMLTQNSVIPFSFWNSSLLHGIEVKFRICNYTEFEN